MRVLDTYPVVLLEKIKIEDSLVSGGRTASNNRTGVIPDNVKSEAGTFSVPEDKISDSRRQGVSDSVVKIKAENDDPSRVTHNLVGCFHNGVACDNQEHPVVEKRGSSKNRGHLDDLMDICSDQSSLTRENIKNEAYSCDLINICPDCKEPPVPVFESTVSEAVDKSPNEPQTELSTSTKLNLSGINHCENLTFICSDQSSLNANSIKDEDPCYDLVSVCSDNKEPLIPVYESAAREAVDKSPNEPKTELSTSTNRNLSGINHCKNLTIICSDQNSLNGNSIKNEDPSYDFVSVCPDSKEPPIPVFESAVREAVDRSPNDLQTELSKSTNCNLNGINHCKNLTIICSDQSSLNGNSIKNEDPCYDLVSVCSDSKEPLIHVYESTVSEAVDKSPNKPQTDSSTYCHSNGNDYRKNLMAICSDQSSLNCDNVKNKDLCYDLISVYPDSKEPHISVSHESSESKAGEKSRNKPQVQLSDYCNLSSVNNCNSSIDFSSDQSSLNRDNIKNEDFCYELLSVCPDNKDPLFSVSCESVNRKTVDKSLNEPQVRLSNSNSIKLAEVSVKLVDLFSSDAQRQGKAHSNQGFCSCIYCRGEFRYKCIVSSSSKSNESGKPPLKADSARGRSKNRLFKCAHCPATFKKKDTLKDHLTMHSSDRPFKCSECEATFKLSSNLKRHLKTHDNKKQHVCPECPKIFKFHATLNRHIKKVHGDKRIFKYNDSAATYKTKCDSRSHMKVDSSDRLFKCNECKAEFKFLSNLRRHLKMHNDERPYVCTECPKAFKSGFNLNLHSRRVHSDEKRFKCNECTATFKEKRALKGHFKVHSGERPFECTYCEAKFKYHSNMKVHLRIHDDEKPYRCTECPKTFRQSGALNIHLRVHSGERPFKCSQCPKAFAQSSSLNSHLKVHSSERPFKCGQCPKAFKLRASLSAHMVWHSGERPFKCSQCPRAFTHSHRLNSHLRFCNTERLLKCEKCPARFKKQAKLDNHMREHSLFECNECSAKFKSQFRLSLHLKSHNRDEKPFKCSQCPAEFKQSISLKMHSMVHSEEKPYECNQCPAKFKWKQVLRRHLKFHSGERPFECKQCPAKFKLNSTLKVHLRLHSDEKAFKCKLCPAEFKQDSVFRSHLKSHSNERPFKCKQCPAEFKKSSCLKTHLLVHSNDRAFECKECCAKFKCKSALKIHMLIHSNERSFQCKHCPARFNQRCGLKSHILNVHSSERPFRCEHCLSTFKSKSVLKSHLKSHSDERAFECKECLMKFKYSSGLRTHLRKFHSLKVRSEGPSDERSFECKRCPAVFEKRASLVRHRSVHSRTLFKCNECEAEFGHKIDLSNHLKEHGVKTPCELNQCVEEFESTSNSTARLWPHLSEGKFSCAHCSVKFGSKKILIEHLKKHCAELHHVTLPNPFN